MSRVNIESTLATITFPDEIWDWLDLLGEVLRVTEEETLRLDATFVPTGAYQNLLVASVHQQVDAIKAIYLLLRAELSHQAAGQVRLLCEGLITLRYIGHSPLDRVDLFLGYASIQAYEAAAAILELEGPTANPRHRAALDAKVASLAADYERRRPDYEFTDKKGRTRPFRSWCHLSVADQASRCGPTYERLYRLVYAQMSAYVHGSAWSLRHIHAYSGKAYNSEVVLWDITAVTMATIAIWFEFAALMGAQVDSQLPVAAPAIAERARRLANREPRRSPRASDA